MTVTTTSNRPTLTQVQIIQSLAEALAWFEKEVNWGVSPGELRHLTARIGELYAAMITRGQMALAVNQHGYDVISASNERISVKTATTSSHVDFSKSTFHHVDRVMVFRINVDDERGVSVEEVLDCPAAELESLASLNGNRLVYPISRRQREQRPVEALEVTDRAFHNDIEILRYESGAIRVHRDGLPQKIVVKDLLRSIAKEVGVDLLNSKGGLKNTQTLGADVIRAINALTIS
ncbi:hypothetical protein GOZ78_09250 [Agrobacterium vitis]|uniref:DUF6998 domain-containing protein n=1 Tax=Agrobacterium vitis TaxID=373 RepID=A0ABD6G5C7_AGRVI|nr:hypothetical protein [Agrobacterium vitis]MUO78227.1 hypothetical protein [Agrobacterium vitis]MUO94104.1 hypothetical protein [Agrobacterium vitis]MUP03441.1 hypothetical protein [Agrobacterium vitis]MUZ84988.1 hypothetical protein [Agrobacterium vitis]MVA10218.1 hypothetical protein [Agrobacterium vitis]